MEDASESAKRLEMNVKRVSKVALAEEPTPQPARVSWVLVEGTTLCCLLSEIVELYVAEPGAQPATVSCGCCEPVRWLSQQASLVLGVLVTSVFLRRLPSWSLKFVYRVCSPEKMCADCLTVHFVSWLD